jgi:hypothetical protein
LTSIQREPEMVREMGDGKRGRQRKQRELNADI